MFCPRVLWSPLGLVSRGVFCHCGRSVLLLSNMACGKLNTSEFHYIRSAELLRLEQLFSSNGYTLRVVGGAVRDLLLNRPPKDIDLATDCTPDEMVKLFEAAGMRYIPTGLQHGTITVHTCEGDYEITTLRVDRVTDGRHAVVDFTKDWEVDASRRDLTINAMSLSLDGSLFDYYNGQTHIAEQKIEFVDDAKKRIEEDYLRILRYFRFYGQIANKPDHHNPSVLDAIRDTANGLKTISVERVWMEMSRILTGNHAPHLVQLMYQLGVANAIGLPTSADHSELSAVWTRTFTHPVSTLKPVSMLMALVPSLSEAEQLMHSWKLSNNEQRLGRFIVTYRSRGLDQQTQLEYFQDLLVDGAYPDSVIELLHYCGRLEYARQLGDWEIPHMPMTGKHLLNAGIKSGPEMGRLVRLAKEKWKESRYTMTCDELLDFVTTSRTQ